MAYLRNVYNVDVQAVTSPEEFLQQLPQFDQDLAKRRQEAEDSGEVSIFLKCILCVNQEAEEFDEGFEIL